MTMPTESDRIGQNDGESRLTARQLKFLPVLLASPTYTQACKAGRVSRDTLYEWLRQPQFKAELERQRDELVTQSFALLSQSVGKAVENKKVLVGEPQGRSAIPTRNQNCWIERPSGVTRRSMSWRTPRRTAAARRPMGTSRGGDGCMGNG